MPYKNKELQKQYQREWMEERRALYLHGKSCVKCGSKKDLQFDHINPKTKFTHRIFSYSAEKIDAELRKCQVLCKICHIQKSVKERWVPITHGRSGYWRGCRCKVCKQGQSDRMAEYRNKVGT